MAETDSTITAVLGINIDGFKGGLNSASSSLKSFSSSVGLNSANVAKLAAGAALAGAAIVAALVKNSMEAVGAQVDLAKQLNTTYESLTNLKRAGELSGVSFEQIQQASKKLSIAMGEASGGNEKLADTFSRLHLNADAMAKLPLDQRIAAINAAIKENIPATEQAAVAAQLFGSKAALAIMSLDSEAIAEGAKQARILGTALNEIEASQIEAAGDSMSVFSEAVKGVGDQLSLQLAPYLDQAGKDFMAFAEQAGGTGPLVEETMRGMITTIGFVADAMAGFKRVAILVLEPLRFLWNSLDLAAAKAGLSIVKIMDLIPGVDMSSQLKIEAANVAAALDGVQSSVESMQYQLNEPLPSEKFRKWAEEAKAASKEAAEAAVKARDATAGVGGGESGADIEAEKKAEEKRQRELEKAREHAAKLAAQKAEADARDLAQRQENADKNISAMEWEFATERERIAKHLEERRKMIADALALQRIDSATAAQLELKAVEDQQKSISEIEKREADERNRIKQQEMDQKYTMINQSIGALAALVQRGGRKEFEQRKKLGIASALVNMYQGIAAGVRLGWPMAIPAVAYAAATGMAAINNIRKQHYNSTGGGSVSTSGAMGQAPSAGGGGGGGGGSQTMFVRGIDPRQMFSGQQLVDIINNATKSGAVLRVA